jgi:hypothetical protein
MSTWQSLDIKRKLNVSITMLAVVLAGCATILAGVLIRKIQTQDMWTKGVSLVRVLSPAVGDSLRTDNVGTTSNASAAWCSRWWPSPPPLARAPWR